MLLNKVKREEFISKELTKTFEYNEQEEKYVLKKEFVDLLKNEVNNESLKMILRSV